MPALTAANPGADVLGPGNLCPDMPTEPGTAGRNPVEGVEVLGAVLALGLDSSGGCVCGKVPATLDVVNLTALEDAAAVDGAGLKPGRDEADVNLCPGAAVTLEEVVLMPVGVENL